MPEYYIVFQEWLLPTESGRDPCEHTFDSLDEAREYAVDTCRGEEENFRRASGGDCLPAAWCEPANGDAGSAMLTAKNGLDPWYVAFRVFRVTPLVHAMPMKGDK